MKPQNTKDERIDLRLTSEEKELLKKAQKLRGEKSISAFVTRVTIHKAREIIEKENEILASERDKKIFFDAVLADQEPNQKLKEAAKKYKSLQKS
ncbi:MAG: DUF1778 domain-containing protein [Bacteroidales bacterium]|nr:DUF1778 domain-containing protein [Bacteroidales bacterium]